MLNIVTNLSFCLHVYRNKYYLENETVVLLVLLAICQTYDLCGVCRPLEKKKLEMENFATIIICILFILFREILMLERPNNVT